MDRSEDELVKRIYKEQTVNSTKGDWFNLIKSDFEMIEEGFDENKIESMEIKEYKAHIKDKINKAAFKYLKKLQNQHIKVKHIVYEKLEVQSYIKNPILKNEEISHIFISHIFT